MVERLRRLYKERAVQEGLKQWWWTTRGTYIHTKYINRIEHTKQKSSNYVILFFYLTRGKMDMHKGNLFKYLVSSPGCRAQWRHHTVIRCASRNISCCDGRAGCNWWDYTCRTFGDQGSNKALLQLLLGRSSLYSISRDRFTIGAYTEWILRFVEEFIRCRPQQFLFLLLSQPEILRLVEKMGLPLHGSRMACITIAVY